MKTINQWFREDFKKIASGQNFEQRLGAELKFPLVKEDGFPPPEKEVDNLWKYLETIGWSPNVDTLTGKVTNCRKPGEQNDSVASCETGYCKIEFSLAHVNNLFDLEHMIQDLRKDLRPFLEERNLYLLGYGIQPMAHPSADLMIKKTRTSVWDKACPSNHQIPVGEGDDVLLFTLNCASHVHTSVRMEDAIKAVNVINGFAPAQIALTANSNIWKGEIHPEYKCVAEKLWDWWKPASIRSGMPRHPFTGLDDYINTIGKFPPIYVKRQNGPVILNQHDTFNEYFSDTNPVGTDLEGKEVTLRPSADDLNLHNSCYWFNARISRYYTVENRTCDQQPPEDLIVISAITLGLNSNLDHAWEELGAYAWKDLREARESACRYGLDGRVGNKPMREFVKNLLDMAHEGLKKRDRGEEQFLDPLFKRYQHGICPADQNVKWFQEGGVFELIKQRSI